MSEADQTQANRDRAKAWGRANPEKNRIRAALWAQNNQERVRARATIYRQKNRDKIRKSHREWRAANRDQLRVTRSAWTAQNRDKVRRSQAGWIQKNPEQTTLKNHRRLARLAGAPGSHTRQEVGELLRRQQFLCANPACRVDLRKHAKSLDHKTPLALGGSNDISNLQWLCAPCNYSKGAIPFGVWLERESAKIRPDEVKSYYGPDDVV